MMLNNSHPEIITTVEYEDNERLLYVCFMLEYIQRNSGNTKNEIINLIGIEGLKLIYDDFDCYHVQNNEQSFHQIAVEIFNLPKGDYSVESFKSKGRNVPLIAWHSKTYYRLIMYIKHYNPSMKVLDIAKEVYSSWICDYLDDFMYDYYWQPANCIYYAWIRGDFDFDF